MGAGLSLYRYRRAAENIVVPAGVDPDFADLGFDHFAKILTQGVERENRTMPDMPQYGRDCDRARAHHRVDPQRRDQTFVIGLVDERDGAFAAAAIGAGQFRCR